MNTLPRNEYVPFEPPHSLCQQPVILSSICRWQSVRLIATFFATLLVCFFSMAQPAFAHDDVVVAPDGTLHSPVEVVLSADHAPKPGEVVNVTMIATPHFVASAIQIGWSLENGGELSGGADVEDFSNIATHQGIQTTRQVRFPTEGVYKLIGSAQIHPNTALAYGGADVLFFIVKADGSSTITRFDPNASSPMRTKMETTIQKLDAPISAAQATEDDPCYTISGKITRIERTPTTSGYITTTNVPVRFARVELLELDPIDDDTEGEGLTDASGNYSFDFCDNDGLGDTELELYLRLYTQLYDPSLADWDDFEVVYVEDSSYIDDIYEYDSEQLVVDGGGSFDLSMKLSLNQSGPFNIADAIFNAWRFFENNGGASGGDKKIDLTAEVHWEPGYVESDPAATTFYEGVSEEISISVLPTDDDTWDDSPIIHEYGHMIEDNYSCDDSDGGAHKFDSILKDEEFSWSEGYSNYFQSAVRATMGVPNPDWYIDWGIVPLPGKPGTGALADFENWDTKNPGLVTPFNEAAIAAMFWDMNDSAIDTQDNVTHGHAMVQKVYTDDEFNSQLGDEECSVNEYFRAWQALGNPADTDTAAAITQNTGVANPFSAVTSAETGEQSEYTMVNAGTSGSDYQWWKHLILVNDLSKSMQGVKADAVKTVLNEQIADIASNPKGVEFSLYSFDNTKASNNTLLASKFYANLVTPAINAMTTNAAADPTCPVESLRAMAQAIGPKQKGDAWLFTDGDALQSVSVETLVKSLTSHKVKGSFALLGGCNSLPPAPQNVSGGAKNYLGLAANASQQGGIVPYLLTAIGSGGQFLYVDQSKINDAADILRAQLSHSAGAGRWSDYVSDNPTYLYDRLNSWEYKWIDASTAAGGVNQGVPSPQVSVPLPSQFTYYGVAQTNAYVTQYGYLTLGQAPFATQLQNSTIPAAAAPNNALYVLWEDLFWNNPPTVAAAGSQPAQVDAAQVNVFSKQDGDWFAISTIGNGSTTGDERAYQVLLNSKTGEIRYQYKSFVDSSSATVGLENGNGTIATQVSFNDINGAKNGMGYKFTPAPAQPSKTFTVSVDGLMSSVGFLLSGYSGSFEPLVVRTPDNAQISCADSANVLCLNLGLVQYVQVKVNGRKGVWSAVVSAGATGAGTFSFSSIGASSITAESKSERTLSTSAQLIEMKLEKAVTGNLLDGWFTRPNGQRFGNSFRFYDDGAHNDGKAGDGRFGSDPFTPPAAGVGYLWIKGAVDGESFTRSEPIPFNFQPLEVTSLGDGNNFGGITTLTFAVKNNDTVKHCYDRSTQVPSGWTFDWHSSINELLLGLCIDAGQTVTRPVEIRMAASLPNDLPSAATGEVFVTFTEREEGTISDSASATVTRYRQPAYIVINNKTLSTYLRPTGVDTTTLKIFVYDDQNFSVADGTEVKISSSLGTIAPTLFTEKGRVNALFTAGTVAGNALITVMVDSLVATTTISLQSPIADSLALSSNLSELAANVNNATLTAVVRDQWGNPVANQSVRLGVSGDGEMGTVNGSEVMTGTTNANGQLVAIFARGSQSGKVIVSAHLVVQEDGQSHAALEEKVAINVLGQSAPPTQKVFLPLVSR